MTHPNDEAAMLLRTTVLILALFAGTSATEAASTYAEAARLLDGEWQGAGFVLRIDAERAQASLARNRPFEWRRFLIKEIDADTVVFSVGAEVFEAKIEADTLTLTGTSFRGARVLFRDIELRGTTND